MEREKEIAELQRHLSLAFAEQDLESAREIAQRLRDQTKDLYGDSHPVYASALNNMGLVSKSAGDFDEAMNLYTVAVQIYEKTVGKTHPSTITSLRNLGLTYKAMLDTKAVTGVEALHVQESAAEALQDCLQRRVETMEEGHPEIASAMYTLAAVRRYQNQNEEALRLIRESISMLQEWYGEGSTHPVLATAINNLGYHHKVCGELDLAFEPYSEALGMRMQALGEKHPDTIASMNNLAELHLARGDTEKATVIQERILAILTSEKER